MKTSRKKHNYQLNFIQGCCLIMLVYLLIAGIFYFAAGEQLYWRESGAELVSVEGDYATPELADGFTVKQEFFCGMDRLQQVAVPVTTFARKNSGAVTVQIYDETAGAELASGVWDMQSITEGQLLECNLDETSVWHHTLSIRMFSDGETGAAIAPWFASTVNQEDAQFYYNGEPVDGTLCFFTYGKDMIWTGFHYFQIAAVVFLCLMGGCTVLYYKRKKKKKSFLLNLARLLRRYKFLIKQLVSRDFKIKYKRSMLGALWSFVNPLLIMCVQYVVFSTIFKADIENYQVYLLSGIVLFNFFSESSNVAMYAISGNANLITKVYVPKYIYPVSKVLSTSVNLLISLLPLVIITISSGVSVTKAWLLIPYDLFCLLLFCIGIALILSSALVFFRDIQFIWSVLLMVLTYATPVFYPETILPEGFRGTLMFNPMYHFIRFFRTLVMDGVSPEPREYIQCAAISVAVLAAGLFVFKRTQDKFIFYL